MRAAVLVLLVLGVALTVAPVHAGVSPFWRELGGSATGKGVSQTAAPKDVADTSVAVAADGRPVVAYAELPNATATQGPIVVKRWNGTTFQTLGTIAGPGYLPQVRISAAGTIFVAWLQDDANGNSEIRLRMFDGTSFVPLGTSGSPGGITGTNPGITLPFSLAVGSDDHPVVGFIAAAQTGITELMPTPAVVQDTRQIYVRRWNGAAWEFLGGGFSGGDGFSGGGASSAVSFDSATIGSVLHQADAPTLAIDSSGAPVVAFVYVTEFLSDNTDIYVTRWNGAAWEPVGPAVPSGEDTAGLGGAGGVSASDTASFNPSIAAAPDGTLALAWEESSPDDTALYVWLRVWNGTAWIELDGSATDGGISEPFTQNGVPQVAVGPDSRPIVAWNALTADSAAPQIFVKRSSGSAWVEPAFHSASDAGISDAAVEAFAPALALTPSGGGTTAGEPTVAWIDARASSAQVFLRQLSSAPSLTLTVSVGDGGAVKSNPIGVDCRAGTCTADFPSGTVVTLTATPDTGGAFGGWGGACAGTAACVVTINANKTVTAAFKIRRVRVAVAVPAGAVAQGNVGTVGGDLVSCGADDAGTCFADVLQGTRVVLQATPQPANRFLTWSTGPCAGRTNSTCAFTVTGNTTSTALFRGVTGVRVLKVGNGRGMVGGTGISCGADCFQELFSGTSVTLTPTVAPGTTFRGWSGDACNGQPTGACTFVVAGNRSMTVTNQSITATFRLSELKLTVTERSNGNVVNVDPLPDAIDCGSDGVGKCRATLNFGTPVRLQARPIPGSKFTGWTGCTSVVGANCSFTMTANRTVTPSYRDVTSVSLTKTGMGLVASAPAGIVCGAACTSAAFDFPRNTLVKLTATPVIGWDFVGWSGGGTCSGIGPCSFNASTIGVAVAASFSIQLKTLHVTVVGSGSVTGLSTACDEATTPCTQVFPYNAMPLLTPVPAPGFRFTGWSQNCTGLAACKPTITANRSVTATFKRVFGVTVTRQGNASPGAITAPGITCGIDCAHDYVSNAVVTFTRAEPPVGRTFRWLGDCAFRGANPSCTLTIDANKSVIADYSLRQLGLTVNITGPGSVTGPAGGSCESAGGNVRCLSIVNYGTTVLLQAVPRPATPQGVFVRWAGCTTTLGASCSVAMTSNRTVMASFQPVLTGLTIQAADSALPLVAGGRRQYSAIATFDDGSTQDVSARSAWTSSNPAVATVGSTTGLVTGAGFGNTTVTARHTGLSGVTKVASVVVSADTLAAPGSVTVDCSPYGNQGGPMSCLPSGVGFEVECRAFATLAHGGVAPVTEQAAWSAGNAAGAKFLGLSDFGGPVLASFRVLTGTTTIRAAIGGVASSNDASPVNRWVVQSTPLTVSNVSVAPASLGFTDATPAALIATAQFNAVASTAAGCPVSPARPPERDFSGLTGWATVPNPSPVAQVDFFGVVAPLATGSTSVSWRYPRGAAPRFQGSIPINVTLP